MSTPSSATASSPRAPTGKLRCWPPTTAWTTWSPSSTGTRFRSPAATGSVCNTEPLDDKFSAFGWIVREVDGHDIDALVRAFDAVPFAPGRPSLLIANTVKGKGVSFMEDVTRWHHGVPDDAQFEAAIAELDARIAEVEVV